MLGCTGATSAEVPSAAATLSPFYAVAPVSGERERGNMSERDSDGELADPEASSARLGVAELQPTALNLAPPLPSTDAEPADQCAAAASV